MTAVVSYSPYYLDEVMVVKLDTKHYLSYFYHKLLYVKRILTYQNYYFKWGGNAGFWLYWAKDADSGNSDILFCTFGVIG